MFQYLPKLHIFVFGYVFDKRFYDLKNGKRPFKVAKSIMSNNLNNRRRLFIHDDQPFRFSTSVIALPLYAVLLLWLVFWIEVKFSVRFIDYGVFPR
ncbi:hypothetical protein RZS08_37805, partial [Arthrospira platensis SPKY1]|nr:hypothetical protein [Arthrospira platensis SPKY1]